MRIALRCTIDPGLAKIHADERKVKQVLLNLLSNALKFTPEGGAIDVRATALDDRPRFRDRHRRRHRARGPGGGIRGVPAGRSSVEKDRGHRARTCHLAQVHRAPRRPDLGPSQLGSGSTFTFTLPRR